VTPAAPGTFTLGELFEIWRQPLTNTNVAGVTGLPVEIYVTDNGISMKVEEADWSNIELKPHREITIELGTPLAEIPNFTWTD
jgi:vancomycin permeability regulator SanA